MLDEADTHREDAISSLKGCWYCKYYHKCYDS